MTEHTPNGTASPEEWLAVAKDAQLGNYRPAPFVLTRGEGVFVEDLSGTRYLDLSGGVAVLSVGHAHPVLAKAIAQQAARLMHVSNLFYNDRAIELARELTQRTAFDRVFFSNSGAEANEALLKLARRYHHERAQQGDAGAAKRTVLVATSGSFHGRTLGALSVTGQAKYHVGMGPLLPDVEIVPFDDLDAMRGVVDERTAGIIVEPVQGEGGVRVPSDGYLPGLRTLADETGALLLFDEVQTCLGRTGAFLAQEHWGVTPDACSLAKGIGGGFPLGAMLCTERVAMGLPYGSHASTFGGNPLACAAGLAVLQILDDETLVGQAACTGVFLSKELERLAASLPAVVEARGLGLLQGLRLADDVDPGRVIVELRNRQVLLTLAGGNVLRFVPPLTVREDELAQGLSAVEVVLRDPPKKEHVGE